MDQILALIPVRYLPYVTAAISIAAVICVVMPAPKKTSGPYYLLYQAVNWIALNAGHAKNLSAPESKGIVGGPGAIAAPLVATAAVPMATATPAEKKLLLSRRPLNERSDTMSKRIITLRVTEHSDKPRTPEQKAAVDAHHKEWMTRNHDFISWLSTAIHNHDNPDSPISSTGIEVVSVEHKD